MPLQIVRNDITRMEVDAIVNSTNEWLSPGGNGVDASIHRAAGPELARELEKLPGCPIGTAVSTGAYGISGCRYIIHTAAPVYMGGDYDEERLLKRCYRAVLKKAEELGCESLAVPILSAGTYGYPLAEAYTIATGVMRSYLAETESDMMIYIVVFSSGMMDVGKTMGDSVKEYVDDEYTAGRTERTARENRRPAIRRDDFAGCGTFLSLEEDTEESLCGSAFPDMPAPNAAQAPKKKEKGIQDSLIRSEFKAAKKLVSAVREEAPPAEDYRKVDRGFVGMCDYWMERKSMTIGEFYSRSNITRATFSGLRNKPGSVPKKSTALGCVVGLKLSIEEAQDLLMRAGMTLSAYLAVDEVVMDFMKKGIYDIDKINYKLFDDGLPGIGYRTN